MTNKRIFGYDFARGLAIIGMIFVNFKVVMVAETDKFLYQLVDILSGKAAALFVVLAGIGMTLMYQNAKNKNDISKIKKVKISLLKRAAFLFVVGLSFYFIWPADILHYYALYISIGIIFLSFSRTKLIVISLVLIIGYNILIWIFDYETAWNWEILKYLDFFTIKGFLRNMFFNGFHPVIPWLAFLLTGMWIGRIDFNSPKKRKRVTIISLIIYIVFKGISMLLVFILSGLLPGDAEEIGYLVGTTPMPPLFFYMVTGTSLSVFIISVSVYFCNKFSDTLFVKQIISTGQLALSNYFLHVIIGLYGVQLIFGKLHRAFTIEFAFFYALVFSILLVVFSHLWRKKFKRGPLELLMRKITG